MASAIAVLFPENIKEEVIINLLTPNMFKGSQKTSKQVYDCIICFPTRKRLQNNIVSQAFVYVVTMAMYVALSTRGMQYTLRRWEEEHICKVGCILAVSSIVVFMMILMQ